MAAIARTKHIATVTWVGHRPKTPADPEGIRSVPADKLLLNFEGPEDEVHGGFNRPSCVRVRHMYEEGSEIRNTRQLSIVSAEELASIAEALDLEKIDPAWLGATLVVQGIPDFSHVPPSSRLLGENGVGLIIDMENQPCEWPGKEIEMDRPGKGVNFPRAALGKRGVTACVERPGTLSIGDKLTLYVPTQPAWRPGSDQS